MDSDTHREPSQGYFSSELYKLLLEPSVKAQKTCDTGAKAVVKSTVGQIPLYLNHHPSELSMNTRPVRQNETRTTNEYYPTTPHLPNKPTVVEGMNQVPVGVMDQMSVKKMNQMSVDRTDQMSEGNLNQVPLVTMNEKSEGRMGQMSVERLNHMPVERMNQMPIEGMNQMSVESMNQMPVERFNQMTVEKLNQMSVERLNQMPVERMNQMRVERMNQMAVERMNQIAVERMNQIPGGSLNRVPLETMNEMFEERMSQMPNMPQNELDPAKQSGFSVRRVSSPVLYGHLLRDTQTDRLFIRRIPNENLQCQSTCSKHMTNTASSLAEDVQNLTKQNLIDQNLTNQNLINQNLNNQNMHAHLQSDEDSIRSVNQTYSITEKEPSAILTNSMVEQFSPIYIISSNEEEDEETCSADTPPHTTCMDLICATRSHYPLKRTEEPRDITKKSLSIPNQSYDNRETGDQLSSTYSHSNQNMGLLESNVKKQTDVNCQKQSSHSKTASDKESTAVRNALNTHDKPQTFTDWAKRILSNDFKTFSIKLHSHISKIDARTKKANKIFVEYVNLFEKVMKIIVVHHCELTKMAASTSTGIGAEEKQQSTRKRNSDHDSRDQEVRNEKSKIKYLQNLDNDSKRTLLHKKASKSVVELIRYSGVFVDRARFADCKRVSKNWQTMTRMLLSEVFTQDALINCTLMGASAGRGSRIRRPGLNKHARIVIVRYIREYSRKKGWPSVPTGQMIASCISNKICNLRAKYKRR